MKNLSVLILIIIFASSCHDSSVGPENKPDLRALTVEESQVAKGLNKFSFNLLKANQAQGSENSFISPLSVSMALAMVLNGASEDTKQTILNTIDYADFSREDVNQAYKSLTSLLLSMDKKVELGIANSIWYNDTYTVNQDFASIMQQYYDAKVQSLNFQNSTSVNIINQWVENKTNKKIKDLINSINRDEVMFLINTVYFKGDWTYQFDKSKTHKAPFATPEGVTTVDMMLSKGATINWFSNEALQLLDIPYGNEQFRFTIVLPHNADQLDEVINKLSGDELNSWLSQTDTVSVELELPRFTMKWKKDLKETLMEMGMRMSDFPNLFEQPLPLEISRVIHQTYLDINEEGSEAAAATAIGVQLTTAPAKPTRITVDKPFLFMIREKHTGVILFMGELVDPQASVGN